VQVYVAEIYYMYNLIILQVLPIIDIIQLYCGVMPAGLRLAELDAAICVFPVAFCYSTFLFFTTPLLHYSLLTTLRRPKSPLLHYLLLSRAKNAHYSTTYYFPEPKMLTTRLLTTFPKKKVLITTRHYLLLSSAAPYIQSIM